ncbi:MAG: TRAP transporter large permease [Firmicutes bacterium]|nr:TRAP transporter large permease [Bacillota bacterium]
MLVPLLVAFFASLLAGMPVAFAMGIAAMAGLLWVGFLPLEIIPQTAFAGISSFPILAIPFFILAADLMTAGGLTEVLLHLARALVGHIRGALGHVNGLVSVFFAGMSGSALADAAGPGAIEMRLMREAGYEPSYAGALTAATATIGAIIPPSIPMVIYALSGGGVNVADLFVAGIVPGLMLGAVFMCVNHWMAVRHGYGAAAPRASLREVVRATVRALPALGLPVIILVGIRGGVMTATEASAVGVAYGLVYGLISRQIKVRQIPRLFLASAITTSAVLLIVSMGSAFAWILAYEQVPQQLATWVASTTQNHIAVLGLVFVVALVTGMFVDTLPAIVILAPVLAPMAARLGIDPLQLGLVFILTIMAGMLTPPVAPLLFVVSAVGRLRLERLAAAVVPLLFAELAVIWLLILFPQLVTALPTVFGYRG